MKWFVEGSAVSMYREGEEGRLRVRHCDTNEHTQCDIERFSKELLVYQRHLL